ncbi:MAG: ATP-binding protein [Cyanobacteria bacterium RYN_339]|nr:ATP-binding protein [Cyanobacteria bacterium RYN_339]
MADDATIRSLRDALAVSPDNAPLRKLLADALMAAGRAAEAEPEYRAALALAPGDPAVRLGLARAFYDQGKRPQALVVLEDLERSPDAPAAALALYARLLLAEGDPTRAARAYHRAVAADPTCADADLAEELGEVERVKVGPQPGDGPDAPDVERPAIGFDSVGGMDALKEQIRLKILAPLQHPELYKAYGKAAGGGILMYGPPGCGKTQLARATAGEAQAGFIAVGLHEVLDMYLGQSERNLHAVFEEARRQAPCVLFFDEVDALGASRTEMRQSAGRQVINQFLAELDGVQASNEGVLILAATNAPWHLDAAFRRPGRFDQVLFVPPPDQDARAAILRVLLRGKPVETIDADAVARKTEHFSGADLKGLVDRTIEGKLAQAIKDGVPKPIAQRDLMEAAKHQKPTTREWFAAARNYAMFANQGGAYDDVLKYLDKLK